MYKKHKITGNETTKHDHSNYKVAPERRFGENTDEWNKRLAGAKQPLLRRRKLNNNQNENTTLKVGDIIYLLIFLGTIAIVTILK